MPYCQHDHCPCPIIVSSQHYRANYRPFKQFCKDTIISGDTLSRNNGLIYVSLCLYVTHNYKPIRAALVKSNNPRQKWIELLLVSNKESPTLNATLSNFHSLFYCPLSPKRPGYKLSDSSLLGRAG